MEKRFTVTRRQYEVIVAMGEHGSTKEVADVLKLARDTIRAHLAAARERTGLHSALEILHRIHLGRITVAPEPEEDLAAETQWLAQSANNCVIPFGTCVTFTHYHAEPRRLSLLARIAEEWQAEAAGHRDGGRLGEALRANEAGRAAFPEGGELLLQAADLYQRDGQWGRARDCLEGLVGRLEGRGIRLEWERWLWWRAKRALGLLYGRLGDGAHEAEVLGEIGAWVPARLAA